MGKIAGQDRAVRGFTKSSGFDSVRFWCIAAAKPTQLVRCQDFEPAIPLTSPNGIQGFTNQGWETRDRSVDRCSLTLMGDCGARDHAHALLLLALQPFAAS
jgi:hypothetical protein